MANKNIKDSIANIIPPKPSNDKSYGGVPAGWMPSTQYDESDDLDKKWMVEEGIGYIMPYTKRGKKVIENFEECLQAAINMSKDLS